MSDTDNFLQQIGWSDWKDTHTLFALFDCAQAQDDGTWRRFAALDSRIRKPLFEGTPDEGLTNVEPVLVSAMDPAVPQLMSWLLAQEKNHPAVLWLVSRRPIADLQAPLRDLLTVDLPDAPDALLRFYDPRVFGKLMQVLSPTQRARFFTDVDAWWRWNLREQGWQGYAAPDVLARPARLVLSDLQMQKFSELDVAEFAHDLRHDLLTHKAKYPHVQPMSEEALAQQVDEQMQQATAYGLHTEEGVRAYVQSVAGVLGWTYVQQGTHPMVTQALSRQDLEEQKLKWLQDYCAQRV